MQEPLKKPQSINFLDNNPDDQSLNFPVQPHPDKRKKNKFFLYFIIVAIIVISIVVWGKQTSSNTSGNLSDESTSLTLLEPKKPGIFKSIKNFLFSSDDLLIGQKDDRINILLLGVGGYGHDGPYLSDTNIIVSIKPSTKEVSMISVPRDLGVQIENYGIYKINYADAFGESRYPGQGGEYARQIFNQTFNQEIPYYIRADFSAFKQIIDSVGGIDIEVKKSFIDQAYPGQNYSYQTISFNAGWQTMDGEKALQFARSRHGSNGESSDFARAKRQQQILVALKDKVLSFGTLANPVTIQKILESLSGNITTNFNFTQLVYLVNFFKDLNNLNIKNITLDDGPNGYLTSYITPTGMFILAPKSGNFDEIDALINNVFNSNFIAQPPTALIVHPSAYVQTSGLNNPSSTISKMTPFKTVNVEIKNGTWRVGLAARMQNLLSDSGFSVLNIGNSLKRPLPTTTFYLINRSVDNEAVVLLNKKLPGKISMELPDWLTNEYDDPTTTEDETGPKFNDQIDILIVLGTDTKE
ncbi:MAG: hypothetical protein COU29_01415 [Candidatus Magasanikbacteria bacterium CG10_big_fil_rev_8_21_14_0_10_36_32]|uniref:Cell envelope-related transcriptional attenuator domain-containing protein n=1 Tax=Candidatus Magasanikbacteria bacterium CG10_big_fil_rev_8_21_14_0_10_36_32 TaxID=1974646 RepID=A0A2M6W6M0_9BACT|nr:MAG: hypothetical protein COU29_01415 [Candidatus Magasanikbacteria bacterium CG10_big_fil_rev_8_21_14_0_10_36_32]